MRRRSAAQNTLGRRTERRQIARRSGVAYAVCGRLTRGPEAWSQAANIKTQDKAVPKQSRRCWHACARPVAKKVSGSQ